MAAPLFVAGRGKVGKSLAAALARAGHQVRLVPARGGAARLVRALAAEPGALVFMAVPDHAVDTLSNELAAAGADVPASVAFVHLSGALGLEALSALSRRHPVGSFHPLRSFPKPQGPEALAGILVALDATKPALSRRLERLARDIGARPRIVADKDRVLYHVAAVLASNYGVALLRLAVSLLERIGWTEREAVAGLLPLMVGSLEQARAAGPAAALTGPIRRGDVSTVERHLVALEALGRGAASSRPELSDLYRMLGAFALETATEAGLDPAAAERVRRALTRKAAATRRRRRR